MNGAGVGAIEVFDNNKTKIHRITGNTGNVWLQARINMSSGYHQVK